MVKQCLDSQYDKLNTAKLHRHHRVQKILASRRSLSVPRFSCPSSDDVSSLSDDFSTPSEVFISKQQRRKLRNRESAAASRLKKKKDTDDLQARIKTLEHEIAILRSLITEKYPNIQINPLNFQNSTSNVLPSFFPHLSSTQVPELVAMSNHNGTAVHF